MTGYRRADTGVSLTAFQPPRALPPLPPRGRVDPLLRRPAPQPLPPVEETHQWPLTHSPPTVRRNLRAAPTCLQQLGSSPRVQRVDIESQSDPHQRTIYPILPLPREENLRAAPTCLPAARQSQQTCELHQRANQRPTASVSTSDSRLKMPQK